MRQVYNSQREQWLQIALIDRKLTDLTSGGATPHPYGGAMGTGMPSLNSGAVSGGTTPECTATGTPSYGGTTGTGMPSLNSGAVSGGTTPECTATGTPSYGGTTGTGMPSLNSGAVSGGTTPECTATGTPSYGGATGTGMPSLNFGAISGGASPQYTATGTPSYGGATGTGMPSMNSRAGGAMPSSVKALNMTEHFMSHISPRKRQTAEEVMHTFSRFKNCRDVGRLAIVLAKYTYFGHDLWLARRQQDARARKPWTLPGYNKFERIYIVSFRCWMMKIFLKSGQTVSRHYGMPASACGPP